MVAMEMEALLAHRGALVHVDHSHRLERRARARAGASPSAPRGHQEVATATGPAHMPIEVWENMLVLATAEDCKSMKQFCTFLDLACKDTNTLSPCKKAWFWKKRCEAKDWLFKDPNYVPYNVDDAEGLDRWSKQYWLFCRADSSATGFGFYVELLQTLGDGGVVPQNAFKNCDFMDLERLPDGITYIGNFAFQRCALALTSLPGGITTIGSGAFSGCHKLALTSLPEGITTINCLAFYGCKNMALTSLPGGITCIEDRAFQGCSALALKSLPEGIVKIDDFTFYRCSALELKSLPDKLNYIGVSAFEECSTLALTSLPEEITDIGECAFSGCTKLALGSLPEGIKVIKNFTFSQCTSLALKSLPDGIKKIESFAFSSCHKLALRSLPEKLSTIENSAFLNCTALKLTSLPDELQRGNIADDAFEWCLQLPLELRLRVAGMTRDTEDV